MKYTLMSAVVVAAFSSPLLAQTATGSYQDQFGVLSERNMFMRDRPRPKVRDTRPISRPDPNTPQAIERATVLRGVAIEDNELHAYLENSRTGQRFRVAPGDKLASGQVEEIAIDAIAYESGGRIVWIEIGQNLSGAKAEAASGSSRNSSRGYSSGGFGSSTSGTNNNTSANSTAGTPGVPTDNGDGSEAPPSLEEPPTPSPSASSLEERMKQRRQQQRGAGK